MLLFALFGGCGFLGNFPIAPVMTCCGYHKDFLICYEFFPFRVLILFACLGIDIVFLFACLCAGRISGRYMVKF